MNIIKRRAQVGFDADQLNVDFSYDCERSQLARRRMKVGNTLRKW
jgi:hypothetical protein